MLKFLVIVAVTMSMGFFSARAAQAGCGGGSCGGGASCESMGGMDMTGTAKAAGASGYAARGQHTGPQVAASPATPPSTATAARPTRRSYRSYSYEPSMRSYGSSSMMRRSRGFSQFDAGRKIRGF